MLIWCILDSKYFIQDSYWSVIKPPAFQEPLWLANARYSTGRNAGFPFCHSTNSVTVKATEWIQNGKAKPKTMMWIKKMGQSWSLLKVNYQWCGLRPSVLGQDRSETKKIGLGLGFVHCGLDLGLALVDLVLCCETRSNHGHCHNESERHSNFSSSLLFIVSLFCVWNVTTVEINSGVQLLKS